MRLPLPQKGFTLIEMLVSTAIFTVVMVIALGALLAMSESDRKAQTLKSVVSNLHFALDSMSRAVRTGTDYHCGSPTGGDCQFTPSQYFAFTDANGNKVAYCLNGTTLMREVVSSSGTLDTSCGAAGFARVTATEVTITDLAFFVRGAPQGDGIQPKLTVLLSGYVKVTGTRQSVFNLQTSVTQRLYDQ